MHIHRTIRVLTHPDWLIPSVAGLIWPTLLLPASLLSGWSTDELRIIIAHELAHVRRFDSLVNLAQQMIEAVLFFNPCVWWISRQIRAEREACCDAVAAELGGDCIIAAGLLARFCSMVPPVNANQLVWRLPATARFSIASSEFFARKIARGLAGLGTPAFLRLWLLLSSFVVCIWEPMRRWQAAERMMSNQDITKIAEVQHDLQPMLDADSTLPDILVHGLVRTADGSPLPPRMPCRRYTAQCNRLGKPPTLVSISLSIKSAISRKR